MRESSRASAQDRPIRLAIVGRPNSGKSTLVNALLGEERMITGPEPGLTRDAVATDFTWGGRPIRLFDTAGLRRKARVSEAAEKLAASDAVRAIRFAEVVVLLIDAEHPFEKQDLTIGELVADEGRALVIAVNKWDLVSDKQKKLKELREFVEDRLAQVAGISLVAISALADLGLERLMSEVFRSYEIWNRRVPTPHLNRWLAEALERHAPPASKGRRVKIRFMTQASARPPTFVAFCGRPEALPPAYLRYLTNSLRAGLRPAGRAHPHQAAQGRQPVRSRAPLRLRAASSPSPRLARGEDRGEGRLQTPTLCVLPSLAVTLSPLKRGDRMERSAQRSRPLACARNR